MISKKKSYNHRPNHTYNQTSFSMSETKQKILDRSSIHFVLLVKLLILNEGRRKGQEYIRLKKKKKNTLALPF